MGTPVPDLIGDRYELLDVIASGGMATVWRARDVRLDRLVAVKRPHPAAMDDPGHLRIEREARAAAALNHPHLVTVFDTGRDTEGPYLVMELVEGTTLAGRETAMSLEEAREAGIALADALASVHAAGIVHRDVKPANVLMSSRGPLLTDFGIASGPASTSQLTQPGTVVTTAAYAAPEVLAGQPATVAADIFSLGAVLYEMASGRPAFVGTDRSTPPAALEDPHFDAVVKTALSTDPTGRPSASALTAALASAAQTKSIVTPGTTAVLPTPDRPPRQARRSLGDSRWPLSATLGGIIAIAIAIAAVAFSAAGDDPGAAPATIVTPAAPTPTPTTTPPPSTTPPTVATTAPATSIAPDPVAEARAELAAILEEIPPSELKSKDGRDIMSRVDDAIAVAADDTEEAARSLGEAAKKIDEHVEDPWRSAALDAIDTIASALGIATDDDDDDDA